MASADKWYYVRIQELQQEIIRLGGDPNLVGAEAGHPGRVDAPSRVEAGAPSPRRRAHPGTEAERDQVYAAWQALRNAQSHEQERQALARLRQLAWESQT